MYTHHSYYLLSRIIVFNYCPYLYINEEWINDIKSVPFSLLKLNSHSTYCKQLLYRVICDKYPDICLHYLAFDKPIDRVVLVTDMVQFVTFLGSYLLHKSICTTISKDVVQAWVMLLGNEIYHELIHIQDIPMLPTNFIVADIDLKNIISCIQNKQYSMLKRFIMCLGVKIMHTLFGRNMGVWQRVLFKLPKTLFQFFNSINRPLSLSDYDKVKIEDFVIYVARKRMVEWGNLIN